MEMSEQPLTEFQQIFAAAQSSPIQPHSTLDKAKSPSPVSPSPAPAYAAPAGTSAPTQKAQSAQAKEVKSGSIPSLSAEDIQLSGPSPTNVALESSVATTTSDSDKLRVALAEIDRLRSQLNEAQSPAASGLRNRGGANGTATEVAVEKAKEVASGQQGMPVTVCIGLVVGVFLLTYLFL